MKRYLAFIGVVMLPACMPLEQAPLVYSSKQQFGVTVSAAAPDNPGLDVNIGYKGLDAAFVPVVVGKKCPKDATDACGEVSYNLRDVFGTNKKNKSTTFEDAEIAKYDGIIADAEKKILGISADLTTRQSEVELVGQKQSKTAERTALTTDPATGQARSLSEVENNRLATLTGELTKIGTLETQDLKGQIEALKGANAAEAQRRDDARARLKNFLARQGVSAGDDKTDALSVYGSFDGNANGDKNGAALKLGKIFSTGVASQNLTQGIGDASAALAVSACFINALTASRSLPGDDAARAAALEKLLPLCGRPH